MMKKEKPHGIQLLLRVVVRDPDGKVLQDTGRTPSRSFVIQFLEFIGAMFDHITVLRTATDGTEKEYYHINVLWSQLFRLDAGINVGSWGLVVGTGDTAEDNTDYKLDTQLTEGLGAGNITHGTVSFTAAAVVGANVDLEVKRAFANNTGSTITVKEAGAYVRHWTGPTHQGIHCIFRDVLPAPVEVPDKCSITIIYTLRTTV